VSGANGSFSHQNVYVGSDWRVRCLSAPGSVPVLNIDAGPTEISLSLADKDVRASAVEFAAELARATSEFAAEVERRYADQQIGPQAEPVSGPAA
jgi:hypothetical protein